MYPPPYRPGQKRASSALGFLAAVLAALFVSAMFLTFAVISTSGPMTVPSPTIYAYNVGSPSPDPSPELGSVPRVAKPKSKPTTHRAAPRPAPHRTTQAPQYPADATAICADGWVSYSAHRQGTCSHHGGVARWL